MAKKQDSVIALELERFEKIIKRYQDYLDKNNILLIEEAKVRHTEMDVQIKVISALPTWLTALEKLRLQDNADKAKETRGDIKLSGLMQAKQNQEI